LSIREESVSETLRVRLDFNFARLSIASRAGELRPEADHLRPE
jgi:hypothetical protein